VIFMPQWRCFNREDAFARLLQLLMLLTLSFVVDVDVAVAIAVVVVVDGCH